MKIPRLLGFCVLVFWGWQIGSVFLGGTLGVLIEGSRWIRKRWQLDDLDYRRAWDFSVLIAVVAAVYCFAVRNGENGVARGLTALDWRPYDVTTQVHGAIYFSQWWPIVLLPFALVAFYGERLHHDYSTFFWLLRRKKTRFAATKGRVNAQAGYLALSILSASATLPAGSFFYIGLIVVVLWMLAVVRSRRHSIVLWVVVAGFAAWAGYWGHRGLNRLQGKVEAGMAALTNQIMNKKTSELRNHTAIGRIGELKLSGQIVFRVEVEEGVAPSLLREACYTNYWGGRWNAGTGRKLAAVPSSGGALTWRFRGRDEEDSRIRMTGFLGDWMPAVPLGVQRFSGLDAETVRCNLYGAIKVEGGSGYRDFRIGSGGASTDSWPPLETDSGVLEDLQIPTSEQAIISLIATELKLDELSFERKLLAIQNFFSEAFEYSTYQTVGEADLPKGVTALEHFLETGKRGHCEFFATATVLLLREAGIPARYVIGYALNESDGDDRFVVRERHGHAWTTCWSAAEETWIDFDTTPASGFEMDAAHASAFEGFWDLLTRARYSLTNGWRQLTGGAYRVYIFIAAAIVFSIIGYRIFRGGRNKARIAKVEEDGSGQVWPGGDSEFYEIDTRLRSGGMGQWPEEEILVWLNRVGASEQIDGVALQSLVELHQRYRFDPQGLSSEDRSRLAEIAKGIQLL